MPSLEDWGWDERWAAAFAAVPGRGLLPGRVLSEHRGAYTTATADGDRRARLPGAMRHKAGERAALPSVGDWVALEALPGERAAVVRAVLPRRTKLSRKASGEAPIEQIIASNLDTVFVTVALNQDFHERRLERFLTVSRESGAEVVLLLNKLDACPDAAPYLAAAKAVAAGAAIVPLSAKTGARVEELAPWLKAGRTVGFVGSSGVGKSTLINRLLGSQVLKTRETRAGDQQGRHTTTHRELFLLPSGGILLDTPGMREMEFWEAEKGLAQSFEEIDALAASCRFGDCAHGSEPGCAVKAGVESGAVTPARLDAWRGFKKELDARRKTEMRKNWNNPPKGSK